MQSIQLILQDENGKELQRAANDMVGIFEYVYKNGKSFPWLNGVDPYGDTIFNLRQVKHLIDEVKFLSSDNASNTFKVQLEELLDFINKVEQHIYLRFIGD